VAPVAPLVPLVPFAPLVPLAPAGPVGPVAPVTPLVPLAPAGPVGPVGPVAPVTPVGPVGPLLGAAAHAIWALATSTSRQSALAAAGVRATPATRPQGPGRRGITIYAARLSCLLPPVYFLEYVNRSAALVGLVPAGVVTVTSTVPLPFGETAVIDVAEFTVKL